MSRVIDLVGGDLVRQAGMEATYVAQSPHPLYKGLQLVVWRMPDGTWSHDALSPIQEVGTVVDSTPHTRIIRLREAFRS